jgi:hypothetical protein
MSRRVEVDVAEIERLYFVEGLNVDQVGEKLGCSPNTVSRRIRELGRTPRSPGKPEKYPPVEVGVCGTPGCTDPECEIPYGTCHCQPRWLERCWKTTSIATRHDRRRGYIRGMHERFAHGHDRLSDEGRRVQSANMYRKRHDGTITRGRVAYARHGSTKVYGQDAAELAAAKGKKVGPAFSRVDAMTAERILRLAEEK